MRLFGKKLDGILPRTGSSPRDALRCSFCNKSQLDVEKLIAGPTVYICNECVAICNDILGKPPEKTPHQEVAGTPPPPELKLLSHVPTNCFVCGMPMFAGDGLYLKNRGVICPACITVLEAAFAERATEG